METELVQKPKKSHVRETGQREAKMSQSGPKTYQPVPDVIENSPYLLLLFGECFPCLAFVHKVLVDLSEVTLVQVLDYLLLL